MSSRVIFEGVADLFVDKNEYKDTPYTSAKSIREQDKQKIIDEFVNIIPKILKESLGILTERVKINGDEATPILKDFLLKIDPLNIRDNYAKNQCLEEEKLYKKCGIGDLEYSTVLIYANELIRARQVNESKSLYSLLVLLDATSVEAWLGLGETYFLSGDLDGTTSSVADYQKALQAFEKAHLLEPHQTTPAICMVMALIALKDFQRAKTIIHAFNGKQINNSTKNVLITLNRIVNSNE